MKPLGSNFDFSGLQRIHKCSESPPRDAILRNHFRRSVKVQAIQAAGVPPIHPPPARSDLGIRLCAAVVGGKGCVGGSSSGSCGIVARALQELVSVKSSCCC
ncbi:hypothetical protein AVEN_163690-1 [Araneus ventricosus]|uniref:Uncharacterized protein n=1 Tax=Araneus ventricosus TaxID=182803 RepID=A0A4Y2ICE4_ARAVE|nr:hypothetical protein AVEN_163690-1 [Araneus ventricosus]